MKEGSKSWAELSLNFKGTVRCSGPTSSGYYILDGTPDKRTPGHSRIQHDYAIDMQMSLGEIGRSVNFNIYDRLPKLRVGETEANTSATYLSQWRIMQISNILSFISEFV